MTPPFFTASFNIASAAVVPGPPHTSRPISSRICATESPTAGVGANDKSTIPKGTFNRCDASRPTSCPIRVILNAVCLMQAATSSMLACSPSFCNAARTTPGPDTPTLITQSGSDTPWKAPAINGLSSTALQNTTSFAAPKQLLSFVISAHSRTICPINLTASILIPAFVEPILTLEQTISVSFKACGIDMISSRSPSVIPFCTRAEYPPMKLMPISLPALSSVFAYFTQSPPETLCNNAIGVTDTR